MKISIINALAASTRANDSAQSGSASNSGPAPAHDDFSNQLSRAQSQAQPPALKPFPKKQDTPANGPSEDSKPATAENKDGSGDTATKTPAGQDTPATDANQASSQTTPPGADGSPNPQLDQAQISGEIVKATSAVQNPKGLPENAVSDPATSKPGQSTQDKGKADHSPVDPAHVSDPSVIATAAATLVEVPKPAAPPPSAGATIDSLGNSSGDQSAIGVNAAPSANAKAVVSKANGSAALDNSPVDADGDATADAGFSQAMETASDKVHSSKTVAVGDATSAIAPQSAQAPVAHPANALFVAAAATPAPQTPDAQFAQDNHAHIVTSIRSEMLPDGGTMQIRLDPPELGALHVTVTMQNGVLSASFQTSNDQATRMLSHTLGQLKSALESQGVSVQHLAVQQSAKPSGSGQSGNGADDRSNNQSLTDQSSARQEQQRKEAVRRMWARLAGGRDPLDMVA